MQKIVLNITGMHCESCAKLIKMELIQQPGIIQADINNESKLAVIEFDPALTALKSIIGLIVDLGYQAKEI